MDHLEKESVELCPIRHYHSSSVEIFSAKNFDAQALCSCRCNCQWEIYREYFLRVPRNCGFDPNASIWRDTRCDSRNNIDDYCVRELRWLITFRFRRLSKRSTVYVLLATSSRFLLAKIIAAVFLLTDMTDRWSCLKYEIERTEKNNNPCCASSRTTNEGGEKQ